MRNRTFLARRLALIAISSLCSTVASAQQGDASPPRVDPVLSLFEAVETENTRTSPAARPTRESRATTAAPEFTLMGTSRLGGKYSAIVKHRDGDTLIVKLDADGNTPIPDYSGYSIVDAGAGNISIRYPGNNPCIEFTEQGVSCNDAANIAKLILPSSAPLPVVTAPEEVVESVEEQPVNPFEALRNGRAVPDEDDAGNRRFTPRRINPEDVPEGMRIIATPFGDRLVEE